MKAENTEQKALKKAYKKAKRKTVTLWKTLGIITLVFALILTPLTIVLNLFDNTVAAMLGGSFWELINEDPNANYFTMDFATNEDRIAYGADICYQVEAEGAVLLMNNGALPLAAGSKVSTLSSSSVNIVYGGTGSGNVDASAADDLKTALEKSGFSVPTVKPWHRDLVFKKIDYAKAHGAKVIAMDIDASGLPFLKAMTPPSGPKSVAELKEFAERFDSYDFQGIRQIEGQSRPGAEFLEFYPDEASLWELVIQLFYTPKTGK